MAHDVFISYPSKDKTVADAICAKLEGKKVRCWIAPRDIAAGQNFARSIINAIDSCKIFVLVWSVNTNASEHILNEINRAFDQGKPIIPFRIQDVQPTPEMLYYFGRTHWLDALTPPLESHINTLTESIFTNLGIEPERFQESDIRTKEPVGETDDKIKVPIRNTQESGEKQILTEPNIEESRSRKSNKTGREADNENKSSEKQSPGKKTLNKSITILFGSLIVIAMAIILLRLTGAFSGMLPSTRDQIKSSSTATLAPVQKTNTPQSTTTATNTPTPTITPLPDWANEFSEPVLSILKDREPDFQDDFSTKNSNWYLPINANCPTAKIDNGRLVLYNSTNCFVFAYLANTPLLNWTIKMDIWVKTNITLNIGFNHTLLLYEDGTWRLINGKKGILTKEGVYPLPEDDRPLNITYISLGDKNAIYFNGIPTIYYYDYQSPTTETFFFQSNGQNMESITPVEIDNFQVWDLDKIENLSQLLVSH